MTAILNFREALKKSHAYRGQCDCEIWIISDFKVLKFLRPQKNRSWFLAAILNFSNIFKNHLHIHMLLGMWGKK